MTLILEEEETIRNEESSSSI